MRGAFVKPQAAVDKPSGTIGWPRSPGRVFGIAAAFFVVMGTIFINTSVLNTRLPILRNGQMTQVPAGYLVLLVAVPFAIFAVLYGGLEFGASRVFDQSPTRIHFVCTLFAVLEAIRVYMSWAASTANRSPEIVTISNFGGAISFLMLAVGTFGWNLCTSKDASGVA